MVTKSWLKDKSEEQFCDDYSIEAPKHHRYKLRCLNRILK